MFDVVVTVVVMPFRLLGTRLHILLRRLLNLREVLLRRLQISRLQILPQLIEGLQKWIRAGCTAGRAAARADRLAAGLAHACKIFGKCGEILLCLTQIAGL